MSDIPIETTSKRATVTLPGAGLGPFDLAADDRFDRITRLVAKSLGVPVALFSLVGDTNQYFKSEVGLDEPWRACRATPLSHSFCRLVVEDRAPLRVVDARLNPRVADNPAIEDLNVIAYLGMPVRAPNGTVIGSLCGIDCQPRKWSEKDEDLLRGFADVIEDYVGLSASEKQWRAILNTIPQIVWSTLPDGTHDFYNDRWYEFTDMQIGSTPGEDWNDMVHSEDRGEAWTRWQHSLVTGEPYEIEYRLRHGSGDYRWALARALPIRDGGGTIVRWFGTCTDIDELKQAQTSRDLIARELTHRIKNIFAVVNGLITSSARREPEMKAYAESLSDRIRALAAATRYVEFDSVGNAVTVSHDKTLHGLMRTVFAPYQHAGDQSRIAFSGCDHAIDKRAATSLALLLHELATNAVKYGALSKADGRLIVRCDVEQDNLAIRWSERGGPSVAEPSEMAGFGSDLVTALTRQLEADIARNWRPEGLEIVMTMPLDALSDSAATTSST